MTLSDFADTGKLATSFCEVSFLRSRRHKGGGWPEDPPSYVGGYEVGG